VSVAITNIFNGTDPKAALAEAQSTVEFAMG
jgi:lactose/L-arabinose transport system substrate-binding protein